MKKGQATTEKPSNGPIIMSISILALLVGGYFIIEPYREFVNEAYDVLTSDDEALVKDWVSQFGIMGPVAIVLLMVAQMFLFVVPNILLMMIAILSYGPVWGGLLAWFGVFVSSTTGYFIGNKLGPSAMYKFVSPKTQDKLTDFVHDYGFKAILVTRFSSFSNDALSFVAGILKMNYLKYISATLAGILPLIVLLGIYGRDGRIEKALLWISIVSVVGLVAYIIIDKRRLKSGKKKKSKR